MLISALFYLFHIDMRRCALMEWHQRLVKGEAEKAFTSSNSLENQKILQGL